MFCAGCDSHQSAFSLREAARKGDSVRVSALLAARSFPPEDLQRALIAACNTDDSKTIAELIRHGADPNRQQTETGATPLQLAVMWQHGHAMSALLALKADPNLKDALGQTPLHIAARLNSVSLAQALIDSGAKLDLQDKSGRTALVTAANANAEQVIHLLLQRGANPNIIDKEGDNPLHALLRLDGQAIDNAAIDLIDHGVNLEQPNGWGRMPLHVAAFYGKTKIVERLLKAKVPIDAKSSDDMTPLYMAAWQNQEPIVRILLEHGANPNAKSKLGWTPLRQVDGIRSSKLGALLRQYGGRTD